MRTLLAGPHHAGGGLPPYLDALAEGLLAPMFSAVCHAQRCLEVYRRVLDQ